VERFFSEIFYYPIAITILLQRLQSDTCDKAAHYFIFDYNLTPSFVTRN